MTTEAVLEKIARSRIIAILRGESGGLLDEITAVFEDAGITSVEVTLNSPDALASIERLSTRFGERMAVGAGTVLTEDEAARAAGAGARFIVSPDCRPEVVDATLASGLASFPGCFSPTEISLALRHGAHAVKLFPAVSVGLEFVRAMHGPRPGLRMIPTGGVTIATAASWLDAGAWAVGIGGGLVSHDVNAPGGLDRLRLRATTLTSARAS